MAYIISTSETYSWEKMRTKRERKKKGKRKLTAVASCEQMWWGLQMSLLPWISFPVQQWSLPNTFPIAALSFSLASPQTPYRLLLLAVPLALIGTCFDQGSCCMSWFLSLYMHVIRSPNINHKLQACNRKKEEKSSESHTRDNCFPWVPAATIMFFAGVTSWEK